MIGAPLYSSSGGASSNDICSPPVDGGGGKRGRVERGRPSRTYGTAGAWAGAAAAGGAARSAPAPLAGTTPGRRRQLLARCATPSGHVVGVLIKINPRNPPCRRRVERPARGRVRAGARSARRRVRTRGFALAVDEPERDEQRDEDAPLDADCRADLRVAPAAPACRAAGRRSGSPPTRRRASRSRHRRPAAGSDRRSPRANSIASTPALTSSTAASTNENAWKALRLVSPALSPARLALALSDNGSCCTTAAASIRTGRARRVRSCAARAPARATRSAAASSAPARSARAAARTLARPVISGQSRPAPGGVRELAMRDDDRPRRPSRSCRPGRSR